MAASPEECFHCGQPLAGRKVCLARVHDAEVALCCPGCRAAAELIAQLGLDDFYRFRTAAAHAPEDRRGDWLAYDEPQALDALTRAEARGRSILLLIDGITCAACGWLISRALLQQAGVLRASVNTATGRAQVVWDPQVLRLSDVLQCIADLGYRPQAITADGAGAQGRDERRAMLKRLAVAGLGMMQVMMFAVALYAGNLHGIDATVREYLRIVSLMVATPVLLYAGRPFFAGALQALRLRSVTMDVPVSLGLALAYGASVYDTVRHTGEVYFDSVTMFIFFLTVARYVEMTARRQSTGITDSLSRLVPALAHRLVGGADGDLVEEVPVGRLGCGDRILVRAGEVFPADGEIVAGRTLADESMLTGESLSVVRIAGDRAAAGTINLEAPVQMRVTAVGPATLLAGIVALLNRAQAQRPRLAQAADHTAAAFLIRVLIGAAAVGVFWSFVDPVRAFPATLAVLVVACPCALSLATLVAVASANTALARRGVLVTHADAVEGLARTTRVVFDKTGTLTTGAVALSRVELRGARSEPDCLRIAAALEAASGHPIGRAFAAAPGAVPLAAELRVVSGSGIEGVVDGAVYRIGTPGFVGGLTLADESAILLGQGGAVLAAFHVGDQLREDARSAVAALRRQGLESEILSGDAPLAVARVADSCGIREQMARQSPLAKLERVRGLTAAGEFVAMVGDGINDAPVLGGAGVSIAMGRGSALAHASADLILVGDALSALPEAFALAHRARRIIKQNLAWAAAYNLAAMPVAALGLAPPWMAAIGMSLSSIGVVLNSMRVLRGVRKAPRESRDSTAAAPFTLARSL